MIKQSSSFAGVGTLAVTTFLLSHILGAYLSTTYLDASTCDDIFPYITAGGGTVHPSLQCFYRTLASGSRLRGIKAKSFIPKSELILELPPEPRLSIYFPVETLQEVFTVRPDYWENLEKLYSFASVAGLARQIIRSRASLGPEVALISGWDASNDLFYSSVSLLAEFAFLPLVSHIRSLQQELYNSPECKSSKALCKVFIQYYLYVKNHAFLLPSSCNRTVCMMRIAPIAELLNTGSPEEVNTRYTLDNSGRFSMTASKDIPAGAEVIDMYSGSNTNNAFWSFALTGTQHFTAKPHFSVNSEECRTLKSKLRNSQRSDSSYQRFLMNEVAKEACDM